MLALLVFCGVQVMGAALLEVLNLVMGGSLAASDVSPTTLALTLIVTGLTTVLVVWLALRMVRIPACFSLQGTTWRVGAIGFTAAAACAVAVNLLSEQFDLPNLMEEQMMAMASTLMGALAIGVAGPVVEELVFREAILGHMLRRGVGAWMAMFVSSLLFGLIHFNPAQIPFAFAMGMALAMLYYKTGSIALPTVVHVCNNSAAVVQMNLLGERASDFTLTEWLGGIAPTCAVAAVATAVCIVLFYRLMK